MRKANKRKKGTEEESDKNHPETKTDNNGQNESGKRWLKWLPLPIFISALSFFAALGSLIVSVRSCQVTKDQLEVMRTQQETDRGVLGQMRIQTDAQIEDIQNRQIVDSTLIAETQKELEFQNRGYLTIQVRDVVFYPRQPPPNDSCLRINYQYREASRLPVLVKGKIFWELTWSSDIDIVDWMNKERIEAREQKDRALPVYLDTDLNIQFCTHEVVDSLKKAFQGPGPWSPGLFYIHIVYKYEDITRKDYWTYMKWKVELIWNGSVSNLADDIIKAEFSIPWKAKKGEVVPTYHNLPQELK